MDNDQPPDELTRLKQMFCDACDVLWNPAVREVDFETPEHRAWLRKELGNRTQVTIERK